MRARGAGKAPRELSRESGKAPKEPSRECLRATRSPLAGAWKDLANMTTGCNCRISVIRERVTEVELLSHKQFDETIGDPATNVRMITPGVAISSTHWSLSPSEV